MERHVFSFFSWRLCPNRWRLRPVYVFSRQSLASFNYTALVPFSRTTFDRSRGDKQQMIVGYRANLSFFFMSIGP